MASSSSSSTKEGSWEDLKAHMKELRAMVKSPDTLEKQVKCKVKTVFNFCVALYESPRRYEDNETVLQIISGRSLTPLEAAFMWLGAWRPSAAISLAFSVMGLTKQGIQVDLPVVKHMENICLSDEQLSELRNFQQYTNRAEKDLTEELATVQMMLADQDVVTYLMTEEATCVKLKDLFASKVESLRDILQRADRLRVETLVELQSVLNPRQAAHCSIAAFEVAFAMRSLNSATL